MTAENLAHFLGEKFGREMVDVNTEFHVQVVFDRNLETEHRHNFYLNSHGELKWRLSGQRRAVSGTLKFLRKQLDQYDPAKTDLAGMNAAHVLSRSINDASRLAEKLQVTKAVFVDGSFKDGKARIGVIAIFGESVHAFAYPVEAVSSDDAERVAIRSALEEFPDYPIYSDCEGAVDACRNFQIKWISRELNKNADRIATLRGKEVGS